MDRTLIIIGIFLLAFLLLIGAFVTFYDPFKEYLPNYIEGIGSFTGTFTGVIAGIFITYTMQRITNRMLQKQAIKNFSFELKINEEKLDEWIGEITKHRDAVNGDSLHNYHYFFKLSSFIGVSAQQLHLSGKAYEILSNEQFRKLQQTYDEMSLGWEQMINNRISQEKSTFQSLRNAQNLHEWHIQHKPEVINHITFLEQKFKEHRNTVKEIIESLKKHL